jgi:hypothetical protein
MGEDLEGVLEEEDLGKGETSLAKETTTLETTEENPSTIDTLGQTRQVSRLLSNETEQDLTIGVT